MNSILIVYATWTGATRSVAEEIGKILEENGVKTEVRRARAIRNTGQYQGVIIGTSVHMGRVPGEMKRFMKRNKHTLLDLPVAYFVVCLTMAKDTEENRKTAMGYLDQLRKFVPNLNPVDVGLFAGAILTDSDEYKALSPLMKIPTASIAESQPDARDWEAIRTWTEDLRSKLQSHIQT